MLGFPLGVMPGFPLGVMTSFPLGVDGMPFSSHVFSRLLTSSLFLPSLLSDQNELHETRYRLELFVPQRSYDVQKHRLRLQGARMLRIRTPNLGKPVDVRRTLAGTYGTPFSTQLSAL